MKNELSLCREAPDDDPYDRWFLCVTIADEASRGTPQRLIGDLQDTVVSRRLNVVKGLKRTYRIVSFGRS
jgi:hypothetical protein